MLLITTKLLTLGCYMYCWKWQRFVLRWESNFIYLFRLDRDSTIELNAAMPSTPCCLIKAFNIHTDAIVLLNKTRMGFLLINAFLMVMYCFISSFTKWSQSSLHYFWAMIICCISYVQTYLSQSVCCLVSIDGWRCSNAVQTLFKRCHCRL